MSKRSITGGREADAAAAGAERSGSRGAVNAAPRPTETEVTLVVVADPPEPVADAVAALTELEGYTLLPGRDEAIHDRYFDTPGAVLGRHGISLRLRELDAKRLLTIKGPRRDAAGGAVTRDELEAPWPEDAWTLLRSELGETLGVPALPPASEPVIALAGLGLDLVQERRTERRVRAVVAPAGAGLLAELAIDAVAYALGARTVRHHELELEAKAQAGEEVIEALAESLRHRFEPDLRLWPLGKLATGLAVARLLETRGPEAVLTESGRILPAAYTALAAGGA